MEQTKHTILIVEDDPDVAEMLNAYFQIQGYEVVTVNWGEEALKACQVKQPNLIILDIRLPDIDGYEVARRLRGSRRTRDIPIIFLTEKRRRSERLQGLELGADDYITKPFDIQELRLRVRNALRHTAHGPLNNPVTGLPEGALLDERLSECLQSADWALLLIAVEHLDAFREKYGFIAADDVLRAVGLMMQNAVSDLGSPNDFLGQSGPAEFVLITSLGRVNALTKRIRSRLEQSLDYFYPLKDRGESANLSQKLAVRLHSLSAREAHFTDLNTLKVTLAQRKIYPPCN